MCCSRLVFFTCLILILHLFAPTLAQLVPYACSDKGNYTSNSTYRANLNTVLASMSSNTNISYGFYNFSVGENSGKVNAIALCRGDIGTDECRSCVNASSQDLLQYCPNQKEAIVWYTKCMVRYSNRSIFGVLEANPLYSFYNTLNASDVDAFTQVLGPLLERLKNLAAAGNSTRKFAVGSETAQDFQTIHALLMCTPDLDELDCKSCLEQTRQRVFSTCCYGKQGGRYISPSCDLRYETYTFYDPIAEAPPPSLLPPSSPTSEGNQGNPSRTTIVIVVSAIGSLLLIIIGIFIFYSRVIRKTGEKVKTTHDMSTVESLRFDFGTITVATDNFSDENKLGGGGFGAVYKGMLQNGQEIAVKRLSMDSGQGRDSEFGNEVLLVARLQHRNLVRLLGFCLEGNERLLIYEFVPNASLDRFIFDPTKRIQLDWERRYKIIEGIARGLVYLHEDSQLRIIHRDLKASNILLDEHMNPKISDFGTARLLDQTQGNTRRIIGTYGYMPPEYAMHGNFSTKSDIFSFGVLLLEIVSGQSNTSFPNEQNGEGLISYAWKIWREGTPLNLVDPTLRVNSTVPLMRCIHIGLLCVQENIADRPTAASVVLMLSSHSITLAVPARPPFLMYSTGDGLDKSSECSDQSRKISHVQASINNVSITEH
ncbi:putative receptor-like protein kinase At4g00960 [Juglans microcarpa x Juglans regia]|uniref:putative receptor-like protein kinase At4g00960 n=1 Tax=Juglans microcarpa x Juglans regia TaxID=2249226 RepID=UPI001B7E3006|nr:putative receptor-like protein kinase At4g00960 [Juglans microcarpa x Juglans regia]